MNYQKRTILPMILLLLLGIVLVPVIVAQDSCSKEFERIYFGQTIRDSIRSSEPIKKYCFVGQKGDRVLIELEQQSGTLDPLLQLWNGSDTDLLDKNDDRSLATKDARISYTLENDGTYIIYASRTALESGSTSGSYSLSLSKDSNEASVPNDESTNQDKSKPKILTRSRSADDCPVLFDTIEYGETISDSITDDDFYFAYCFAGDEGDEIIIELKAIDESLDPFLILSDLRMEEIYEENDDLRFAQKDARIIFTLPKTDGYLISVTRYDIEDGTTEGDFELSLRLNKGEMSQEDLLDNQPPPDYLCHHNLLNQVNQTQWQDENESYDFRLNFGCEGYAAVSLFGHLFLTEYHINGSDVDLMLGNKSYRVGVAPRGVSLIGDDGTAFVFRDVGRPACDASSLRELTDGVWYLGDETMIGFRVDFLCNGVAIINLEGSIEALFYDYDLAEESLTLYLHEDEIVWTDVFILPGNRLAVKDDDGGLVMKNILFNIEGSDI